MSLFWNIILFISCGETESEDSGLIPVHLISLMQTMMALEKLGIVMTMIPIAFPETQNFVMELTTIVMKISMKTSPSPTS